MTDPFYLFMTGIVKSSAALVKMLNVKNYISLLLIMYRLKGPVRVTKASSV